MTAFSPQKVLGKILRAKKGEKTDKKLLWRGSFFSGIIGVFSL